MSLNLRTGALIGLVFILGVGGCSAKDYSHRSNKRENYTKLNPRNPILLREEYEAQRRGEIPRWDIPVVRNAKVEQWMKYFQGRGKKWFRIWLARSSKYIPMMRKILRDHGLPEDLVYLAMIESGFSSRAYSRARAAGPWQFIRGTGRLYGLKVDFWRDERRDPEKSTVAAARHLKDLYDEFDSWKLAAAAYNAGAGKVRRAIKRYKTEDFWELAKGRYLKPETRHYVPKLIAAALIAKEPRKYGFRNIKYQDPLEYDKVILKNPVNLKKLAKKAGYKLSTLMALNPELNHSVTPPNVKNYELRVPSGASEKILVAYNSIPPGERFKFAAHKVRRGETLSQIARAYGVPYREIMRMNKIRSARRVRAGRKLIIPVPSDRLIKAYKPKKKKFVKAKPQIYKVKKGDNLTAIAKKYGVSIASIKAKNKLKSSKIARGQKLSIPRLIHTVRTGESLWLIAQKYNTSVRKIKRKNKLRRSRIYPGKRLVIPTT